MNTKLTLVMDAKVISSAKQYAESQQTSVSSLVEQYISLVSGSESQLRKTDTKWGPITSSLMGAMKPLPEKDRNKSAKELVGDAKMERFG